MEENWRNANFSPNSLINLVVRFNKFVNAPLAGPEARDFKVILDYDLATTHVIPSPQKRNKKAPETECSCVCQTAWQLDHFTLDGETSLMD